jgi:hypothetical protein
MLIEKEIVYQISTLTLDFLLYYLSHIIIN